MGKPQGFLEYERKDGPVISPKDRITDFHEFHGQLSQEEQQKQGARCMECGVPFCQAGMEIGGMVSGCPLNNLIPEMNDMVYQGNWEQAYKRLAKTHSFPEFTASVCPALCEAACTCGVFSSPVATKENERAVIAYAFQNDLIKPSIPKVRTGKKIAVIGSGPAGLAAAQHLNQRGHSVTVYEKSDRPGGLLRYGIPNMKLDKKVIDRRISIMEKSGIEFKCNVDVGKDIKGTKLLEKYHRVILACGASLPRDINVPGRDAKGIYFAVDFLKEVTKSLLDSDFKQVPYELAKDKNVVVIGGGDTGNDCVATVIRLGAKSVAQFEMMPKAPSKRLESNPWPEWPKVSKIDYGQEEAIEKFGEDPRRYQTTVTEFVKDTNGNVSAVKVINLEPAKDEKTGRTVMVKQEGTEKVISTNLVLIAAGFVGSESYVSESFGVECNQQMNVKTDVDSYKTNVENVYAAGDMRRGQSLVVWAIAEGQEVAKEVEDSFRL